MLWVETTDVVAGEARIRPVLMAADAPGRGATGETGPDSSGSDRWSEREEEAVMLRTTIPRDGFVARLAAVAASMTLITFGLAAVTTSAGAQASYPIVIPIEETSAQTCASLGAILVAGGYLAEVPDWTQVKVDPPTDTTVGPFTVSNMDNSEPPSFDWSATQPMNLVFVKSGRDASQIYLYDPATGATSGAGLTTANGKQISNIVACHAVFDTSSTGGTTPSTGGTTDSTQGPATSGVLGSTTLATDAIGAAPSAQAAPVETLPYTGDETGWQALGAVAVLLGGATLVVVARQRRSR